MIHDVAEIPYPVMMLVMNIKIFNRKYTNNQKLVVMFRPNTAASPTRRPVEVLRIPPPT